MSRPGDVKYFPTPPQFIEFALAVRSDRLATAPMLALPQNAEEASISREERLKISNAFRLKHDLPLLSGE